MTTAEQLRVVPVPCLRDNYSYLVYFETSNGKCLIIDGCEFEPIVQHVTRLGLRPAAILTTHHHRDHVGGNIALVRKFSIPVYAFEREHDRIPAWSHALKHDEHFEIAGFKGYALHVPGHTQGALAYVLGDHCFVGDTIFCAGSGRLLEGTALQLCASFKLIASRLSQETMLYTGHEYTEANLRFACDVFPRAAILARYQQVVRDRQLGQYCASARLSEELATNLFFNCHLPELQQTIFDTEWTDLRLRYSADELEQLTFERLRQLKDHTR